MAIAGKYHQPDWGSPANGVPEKTVGIPARDIERTDRLAEVRVPGHVKRGDIEVGQGRSRAKADARPAMRSPARHRSHRAYPGTRLVRPVPALGPGRRQE